VVTTILKILLLGWIVLIGAILVNGFVNASPWAGWYEYFNKISELGFMKASGTLSLSNIVFLYVGYPLLLGGLAYAGKCLLNL
jgi:hypothetical protein